MLFPIGKIVKGDARHCVPIVARRSLMVTIILPSELEKAVAEEAARRHNG